jgi:hypothetical protein
MRNDRKLVELFLREYRSESGEAYEIDNFPEDSEHNTPAVEAIASDRHGNSLAIEHTLAQPFLGERDDAQPFSIVFEPLESDASLVIPNYDVTFSPAVGIVPKGVNWREASETVKEWFRREGQSMAAGRSTYRIPGLPFDLDVIIHKQHMPNYKGKVFVMRSNVPESFEGVIRKAFSDKLPKLVAANTDRRVLLLERGSVPGDVQFVKTIELVRKDFPQLSKVSEIWVGNTAAWERENVVWFARVWPDAGTARFRVKSDSEHCGEIHALTAP